MMMTAPSIRAATSILKNNIHININKRSTAHLSDDDASSSCSSSSPTANFSTALPHSTSSEDAKDAAGSKRQSLRIKSHEAPTKPKRKRISQEQFQKLTELFEQTDTPNYELREKLAVELNMTNREVQVWFQNRRAKYNRARQQEHQRTQQFALQKHHHSHYNQDQYQRYQEEMSIYPPTSHYHHDHHRYYHYDTTQQQQRLHHYQDPCDSYSSTSSSSSSNVSTPTLSPDMGPLEILAMAADYIQRFDQEEDAHHRQKQQNSESKKRRLEEPHDNNSRQRWRPWL